MNDEYERDCNYDIVPFVDCVDKCCKNCSDITFCTYACQNVGHCEKEYIEAIHILIIPYFVTFVPLYNGDFTLNMI